MPISRLQYVDGGNHSLSATFGSPVASGSAVVVFVRTATIQAVSSVSDNKGNAYSLVAESNVRGPALRVFVALNVAGGSGFQITVTLDGEDNYFWTAAAEYSGVAASDAIDVIDAVSGLATTDLTSNPITTVQSDCALLVVGSQGDHASYAAGPDFTLLDGSVGGDAGGIQERILTGTVSGYTVHLTSNGTHPEYTLVTVALRPAGGTTHGGRLLNLRRRAYS